MRIIIVIIMTILPVLLVGRAWGACPAYKQQPSLVVSTNESAVSYKLDASLEQMFDAASEAANGSKSTNISPNLRGLTVVRLETRMSISTAYMSDGKILCAYPVKVDVFVGYPAPQVVYILGRYAPGTCQFDAIRDHENGHVRINVETLRALLPQLETGMRDAIMNPGYPVETPNKEWAQEAIKKSLGDLLRAYVAAHIQQRASLNAMLDTPEGYAFVQRKCPSW